MDVNDLRSAVTLASLVLFLVLVALVWLPRRKAEFEAAAHLPFEADEPAAALRPRAVQSSDCRGEHSGHEGSRP